MAKFRVTVTRTVDVEVEIGDDFDAEAMAQFRRHLYPFHTLEEHAEHIAQYVARFDSPDWLEGYGPVKYDGRLPYQYRGKPDEVLYDINIRVGREDVDMECEEA